MESNSSNEMTLEEFEYICNIFLEFCDSLSDIELERKILVDHARMSDSEFEELLTSLDQAKLEESIDNKNSDELKDLARSLRQYVIDNDLSYEYLESSYDTFINSLKADCIGRLTNIGLELQQLMIKCYPSVEEQEYIECRDSVVTNNIETSESVKEISDYFRHLNTRYIISEEEYAEMLHNTIIGAILEHDQVYE